MRWTVVEKTAHLPEEQRETIRWLYTHAQAEGMSASDTARAVRMDSGTLTKVLQGKYTAGVAGVVTKITNYRALFEKRVNVAPVNFITTETSTQIADTCDWAHQSQTVAFLYGVSQIGKTAGLKHYKETSEPGKAGQVRMIRMPAAGGVQMMLSELLTSCGLPVTGHIEARRREVLKAIDSTMILVVDELHQVFATYQSAAAIRCLEILREIYDLTGCGLVLCGTDVLREEFKRGKMAQMLSQLMRRGVTEVQLPAMPSPEDVDSIAAAYGLPPARGTAADLQTQILTNHGLGKLIKFLQAATRLAVRQDKPMSWEHFLQAHDILLKLSAQKGGAK